MTQWIERLDHFVLTVADVAATCAFYQRVLGMGVVSFQPAGGGAPRFALTFGRSKINLHQRGQEFEPKARVPQSGSADFCLITKESLPAFVAHLQREAVPIEEGPVRRTGAEGTILSVYFRDPDGNLVEVSTYQTGGREKISR